MALTEADRKIIQTQITEIEEKIKEDSITAINLETDYNEAKKREAFNKKQWNYYHLIITNYEREIEALDGVYIESPLSEQDISNLADNTGRLYQGVVSTGAKIIPQMVGGGISASVVDAELHNQASLEEVIDVLRNGKGYFAFTPIQLYLDYIEGQMVFTSTSPISAGNWYMLGDNALVEVGIVDFIASQPTGTCSNPIYTDETSCTANGGVWTSGPPTTAYYSANITRIYVGGSASAGTYIKSWPGYSNTERATQTPTSTTAQFFTRIMQILDNELAEWLKYLSVSYSAVIQNEDPLINTSDKGQIISDYTYVNNYKGSPNIQDGSPGLDELLGVIAARVAFIPTRVATAKEAKSAYYSDRIDFTNLRADIQSGSLTTLRFLSGLKEEFPVGGSPELKKRLLTLKQLLEQG